MAIVMSSSTAELIISGSAPSRRLFSAVCLLAESTSAPMKARFRNFALDRGLDAYRSDRSSTSNFVAAQGAAAAARAAALMAELCVFPVRTAFILQQAVHVSEDVLSHGTLTL